MNPIIRNILAVLAGLIAGSIINMSLIMLSGSIIAIPDGVDNSTTEGLKASMHLFEPRHYIMPFLAHALGTLVGATVASAIAIKNKLPVALIIGAFFLVGGVMMVFQLPSPMWFNALDLIIAYLPMAYLGFIITHKKT